MLSAKNVLDGVLAEFRGYDQQVLVLLERTFQNATTALTAPGALPLASFLMATSLCSVLSVDATTGSPPFRRTPVMLDQL